ncbi:hypothetical protein NKOR_04790 [Candidatus Nitrosopumilus koreensis AR1]|uniref:Uncharacterized protein n=1 Tax=Candidatus Nitrosopumilus koreensis AR1 TaxID=1229908 RepID=K0B5W2_9ARCH|nr:MULTISPECIES: hypothetical protein [Nitrosopumilus]AFS80844.1 hypothetical protein NKOR_04790 [Candidatus Nitrosopumilus koreensis AR1]
MSLIKFNVIDEFKTYLENNVVETKKELEKISKIAGEKLRSQEKELENDKEFLSIKEKLEDKSDEKKTKKTKKQTSSNWIKYNSLNLYNGMGIKGELELYFKEIESLKIKLEKLQSAKETLDGLVSKGLKNNLNSIVYEDGGQFEIALLKNSKEVREKFKFKTEFTVPAKLEKPLFVESLLK